MLELIEQVRQSAATRRTCSGAAVSALPEWPPGALREPQDPAMHQPSTLRLPGATLPQLPRRLRRGQQEVRSRMHQPRLRQATRHLPFMRPRVIVPRQSNKTGTFEGCTEYFSKLECTYTRNTRRGSAHR